tara:strand:+ start:2711 stop:3352 length:642 start_codon:yes stop_codon:yes gene_type:complete
MSWVMVGIAVVGGASKMIAANQERKARKKEQQRANAEMARQKRALQELDLTNPYANLENTMEDLTINQQQVAYETQQTAVNQANTMQALQGAAGGSGIAGLAQQIMNQGQQAAQRTAANIGQQERANQMAKAQQAAQLENQRAQGEQWVYNKQQENITGQLRQAAAEKAAATEGLIQANTAMWSAGAEIAGGVGGGITQIQSNKAAGKKWYAA